MIKLRYFACSECETVYADFEAPPFCGNCESDTFDEISENLRDPSYFYSPSIHERTD